MIPCSRFLTCTWTSERMPCIDALKWPQSRNLNTNMHNSSIWLSPHWANNFIDILFESECLIVILLMHSPIEVVSAVCPIEPHQWIFALESCRHCALVKRRVVHCLISVKLHYSGLYLPTRTIYIGQALRNEVLKWHIQLRIRQYCFCGKVYSIWMESELRFASNGIEMAFGDSAPERKGAFNDSKSMQLWNSN